MLHRNDGTLPMFSDSAVSDVRATLVGIFASWKWSDVTLPGFSWDLLLSLGQHILVLAFDTIHIKI